MLCVELQNGNSYKSSAILSIPAIIAKWYSCACNGYGAKYVDAIFETFRLVSSYPDIELVSKLLCHYRAGLGATSMEEIKVPNKFVGLSEYSFVDLQGIPPQN